MSKEINLTYEGKPYTLTFTKRTVDQAANMGINPDRIKDNPIILEKLFWAALVAKHPKVTQTEASRIYMAQNPKTSLFTALLMLWNDVTDGLVEDAPEGEQTWTANFDIPNQEK